MAAPKNAANRTWFFLFKLSLKRPKLQPEITPAATVRANQIQSPAVAVLKFAGKGNRNTRAAMNAIEGSHRKRLISIVVEFPLAPFKQLRNV